MCRRGACLASESSSIPIRGPKPLSVKGAFRRWKTYRGNGNFCQPLTGEKNEVKKEKKIQSVLEASSSSSRSLPPPPHPQPEFHQASLTPPLYSWVERDSVRANCFARGYNILSLPGQLSNLDFSTGSPVYWPSGHHLTILTKIKLVKWKNRKILVKNSWLVWRGVSFTSYNIYMRSKTYSWESFCDRGPDGLHLAFANGTLSAMLDEEKYEKYLTSLLVETKRRVIPATNFPLN